MAFPPVDMNAFGDFHILQTNYKEVQGHGIRADILIPKTLSSSSDASSRRPVILRLHGGFLITLGSFMFFQPWILKYALKHHAIVVSANYRLLPESRGVDALADVDSIMEWIGNSLQPFLSSQEQSSDLTVDASKLLVVGESAGGYLTTQAALSHGSRIKAAIAQYPIIDIESPFYATPSNDKIIMGNPQVPLDLLENYVKKNGPNPAPMSEDVPPTKFDLCLAAIQQGKYRALVGPEEILYPLRRVQQGQEMKPHYFLLHGREDSAVPVEHSQRFVQLLQQKQGDERVRLAVQPGEHGFDATTSLDEQWLEEELELVTKAWLE